MEKMADERETAQWYTADCSGDGKRVIDGLPEPIRKQSYRFGMTAAWNYLPVEARDALRRKLYDNRITCYNHGKNYNAACPVCKEILEAK